MATTLKTSSNSKPTSVACECGPHLTPRGSLLSGIFVTSFVISTSFFMLALSARGVAWLLG